MSKVIEKSLSHYVAACHALAIEASTETVAEYAAAWRLLFADARAVFGPTACFEFVHGLIRGRCDRASLNAIHVARREFTRLAGHPVLCAQTMNRRHLSSSGDDGHAVHPR